MRCAIRPHQPRHGCQVYDPSIRGIGKLRVWHVHSRPRHSLQCAFARVAYDPDNLANRLALDNRAEALAEENPIPQWILIFPVLLGHGFIDHHYRGRSAVVAIRKRSPALQGDIKDLEVTLRNRSPSNIAGAGVGRSRSADNIESEVQGAL